MGEMGGGDTDHAMPARGEPGMHHGAHWRPPDRAGRAEPVRPASARARSPARSRDRRRHPSARPSAPGARNRV